MIDILVQKGPKRDLSIEKGPKDKFSRRFSATQEFSQMEKSMTENGLCTVKSLTKCFVFVANY
jgi:hypothetical protein